MRVLSEQFGDRRAEFLRMRRRGAHRTGWTYSSAGSRSVGHRTRSGWTSPPSTIIRSWSTAIIPGDVFVLSVLIIFYK